MLDGRAVADIPGWLFTEDVFMINWLLADQAAHGVTGDLVEIGAYYGKSAVIIGAHLRPDERFTVVDLFESPAADTANEEETAGQYTGLTRAAFEGHYLRFHDHLPVVVQGLSSAIVDAVEPGTVRFMHIDGSHLYDHVRGDIEAARSLLKSDGIAVFDDFRTEHTPGTAAAVWEAVANTGLKPIALTPMKLYASWGDIAQLQDRLVTDLDRRRPWPYLTEPIAGTRVVRLYQPKRSLGYQMVRRLHRSLPPRYQKLLFVP
jgi:hypothetical protein